MKNALFSLAALALLGLAVAFPAPAAAETNNLIPNWEFGDRTNPLATWRIDFPYQGSYVKNASYVKLSDTVRDGDTPAVELDLPKGVAENEGGKVETALVKIEPGATYHASVDVMTFDLAAKFYVEVYALDPTAPGAPSLDRIPARDGLPALVKCYRAGFDDPKPKSKSWVTAKRDFTVPAMAMIAGKPEPPMYAAIKAWGLAEWVGGSGKVYFSKFVLTKIR
jgi:hypothetical protein